MKKTKCLLSLSLVLLMFACGNLSTNSKDDITAKFDDREVSIYTGESSNASREIESYQANVKTFYSNNRIGVDMEPQQEYRLSMKVIDGQVYSRIDFDSETFPDQRSRSIVSNDKESILFYSETGQVESRFPVDQTEERFLLDSDKLSALGRIDIDFVLSEAKRLAFDINDETPGALMVNVPASAFKAQSNGYGFESSVVSCKLNFDTDKSVLVSSTMEVVESDGTTIGVETHPLYQEENGVIVKVGQVQVVDNKPSEELYEDDSVIEEYESVEDIPEITDEELAQLQESGEVSLEETDILLGDQSSADFQEVFVDLYDDVEVNTLSDSLFKMALEG